MTPKNTLSKAFYFFLIGLILWTALILILSFSTGQQSTEQSNFISQIILNVFNFLRIPLQDHVVNELHVWVRKLIGHFGMFAIDGFFAYMTFRMGWLKKSWQRFLFTMMFGLTVAALTETAQLFVPERAGLVVDALIDLLGFALGCLTGWSIALVDAGAKKHHG